MSDSPAQPYATYLDVNESVNRVTLTNARDGTRIPASHLPGRIQ